MDSPSSPPAGAGNTLVVYSSTTMSATGLDQNPPFPKISSNFDRHALGFSGKTLPSSTPSTAAADGFSSGAIVKFQSQQVPGSDVKTGDSSNPKSDMLGKDAAMYHKTQQRSYVNAAAASVNRSPDIFVSNLQSIYPVKQGNNTIVIMPETMYEERLRRFQFGWIGRLVLPKGSAPIQNKDLKSKLSHLFSTEENWKLVPLRKGFFSLSFASSADHRKAGRYISWKLQRGLFHLRDWKPNFDPYRERISTAQVWIRLYHLPEEYWEPAFLAGVFRCVGNVIKLDGSTTAGEVGHFARALVEVDLVMPLTESVSVGRSSNTFQVSFGFENLPLFCNFCKFIGHSVDRCYHAKKKVEKDGNARNGPDSDTGATEAVA